MADKGAEKSQTEAALIIVALLGFALVGLIWYNFHIFANMWRYIRLGELYLFQWIPAFAIPYVGTIDFSRAVLYLSSLSEYGLTIKSMTRFDNIYAPFVGVPMSLFIMWRGLKLNKVDKKLNKIFDMESMFEHFVGLYPHLREVFDAHPEQKSIHYNRKILETYRWGKMVNPLAYAKASPPFLLEEKAKENGTFNKAILDAGGIYDEDLAEHAFAAQLGEHWKGEAQLTPYEKVAFNFLQDRLPVDNERVEVFVTKIWNALVRTSAKKPRTECPQIKKFSDEENELMRVYWKTFEKEFRKVARIDKCDEQKRQDIITHLKSEDTVLALCSDKEKRFKKYYQRIRSGEIMAKHSYVRTGLMQMNEQACKGGRISLEPIKSQLKSNSRELWYALKASGRRTSFPESAGIFAHWLLEQDLNRPVGTPCVQEAVEALRNDLNIEDD